MNSSAHKKKPPSDRPNRSRKQVYAAFQLKRQKGRLVPFFTFGKQAHELKRNAGRDDVLFFKIEREGWTRRWRLVVNSFRKLYVFDEPTVARCELLLRKYMKDPESVLVLSFTESRLSEIATIIDHVRRWLHDDNAVFSQNQEVLFRLLWNRWCATTPESSQTLLFAGLTELDLLNRFNQLIGGNDDNK